jgi:branched-chain amino acid transport system substrate-binding protein
MKRKVVGVVAIAALALVAGCGSSSKKNSVTATTTGGVTTGGPTSTTVGPASNTSSDVGVTPTTIKLGYISSLTGNASSTFADGPAGAMARIAAQNAAGGIDGRKIELVSVDDQSSPAGDATASQVLATQKGIFGVIDYSPYTFGGARVLQEKGIPVTGYAFDGPEWGAKPNSNMFSYLPPYATPYDGDYYYYDWTGKFLHEIGATKPAGLAYGISPSSQASIKVIFAGAASNGLSACYQNYSVPFGGVDFTAAALAIKNSSCDAVIGSFVDSSDVGLSTAVKQTGIAAKQLYFTGYDQATLSSPSAKTAFEGDYFQNVIIFDPSNPAIATMLDNLAKYDSSFHSGNLPDFGLYGSYIAADLMIKGLEGAGQNPTRKSFISNLRQVSSYDAGGILPSPTTFTNFGTPQMLPPTYCFNFVQLKSGHFVNANPGGKPVCAGKVTFKP